jgi:hypothetical protein
MLALAWRLEKETFHESVTCYCFHLFYCESNFNSFLKVKKSLIPFVFSVSGCFSNMKTCVKKAFKISQRFRFVHIQLFSIQIIACPFLTPPHQHFIWMLWHGEPHSLKVTLSQVPLLHLLKRLRSICFSTLKSQESQRLWLFWKKTGLPQTVQSNLEWSHLAVLEVIFFEANMLK